MGSHGTDSEVGPVRRWLGRLILGSNGAAMVEGGLLPGSGPVTPAAPFELRGCRELLVVHEDSLPIRSSIEVIERSIPGDPGLAFTHCRGLLETVCKTILADRGISSASDAKPNWLMSQTLKVLKLTPDSFDGDNRVEDGVEELMRGVNQVLNGVVALRKSQGIGPHGKDALEAILDADYAVIAATATDTVAALLYRMHRKQAEKDPLSRVRFGEYSDFDKYLDDKYPDLVIEETPLLASKALYMLDLEAYRQRLMLFLSDSPEPEEPDAFAEGERVEEEDING